MERRDICDSAVTTICLAATGTRPEKSGMKVLVMSMVGTSASRIISSMQASESLKLDIERTGRVAGRSEALA